MDGIWHRKVTHVNELDFMSWLLVASFAARRSQVGQSEIIKVAAGIARVKEGLRLSAAAAWTLAVLNLPTRNSYN